MRYEAQAVPKAQKAPSHDSSPKHSQKRSTLTVLFSALAVGTALSILLLPRSSTHDRSESAPPRAVFLGEELPLDHGAIDAALERARKFSESTLTLVLPDQRAEIVSLSKLGATIETTRLSNFIRDLRDGTSELRRRYHALSTDKPLSIPVPLRLDAGLALSVLLGLKDALDTSPEDARIDLNEKRVRGDVEGRALDVDKTLERIDQALARGELRAEVAFVTRPAAQRKENLSDVRFENVLGHFETKYSRSKAAEARTYNLRRAALSLDGTVLLPGQIFDFNRVVGPRDEAHGYKVATVIADGELADGIGGGTCQISGTLHGAAFFAGLEIVERYPHTRPSSYIKMGLDATVVYPTINFRLRNPFDFPVVLHMSVKDGVVRAEVLGPKIDQVVTMIRRIDEALPYDEVERPLAELPKGQRVLLQRGVPGFRLHRYRVARRGNQTVREKWRDIYPPTTQIVGVGTGDVSAKGNRKSDTTPEYLADELLILTLRRSSDSDPGSFAENRQAGQFGEPGWSARRGMPFWGEIVRN
ncbi:MAG: hypothetical protein B6A08_02060 [Sorangiineae bacterium NIC37A_2]|nr:MAG: hypothetical protein B6A08_02060 [Sorangiineae bacterium NIC37A_2]